MRVQKRNPWLYGLGVVLAAMTLLGTRAGADVTSDRPGSVVIWPKVIADGTRDTIISLTNTSNTQAYAHCEYVNGNGICSLTGALCTLPSEDAAPDAPACPGGTADICVLDWVSENFDIILTRQQPTFWRVSTGRIDNPLLNPGIECDTTYSVPPRQSCPGFFLVGQVIPPVQPFQGELRCVQTSMDGNAIAANALKGEAKIETLAQVPQLSEYNSINVRAISPPVDDPSILPLNGADPTQVAYNVYNACPEAVEVTNYARGAEDLVAAQIDPTACDSTGCPVTTEFTVIPCRADFENEIATRFTLFIEYTNEFEQTLSIERDFNCWTTFTLENLGFQNVADSIFQRTRITPTGSGLCIAGDADLINTPCSTDAGCGAGADAVCAPASGILAVVEEFHSSDITDVSVFPPLPAIYPPGSDAANFYGVDVRGISSTAPDGIVGKPGRCRGALTTRCYNDTQCPAGKCRSSGTACSVGGAACPVGDFCDQCMNDEIRFQPDVIVPVQP